MSRRVLVNLGHGNTAELEPDLYSVDADLLAEPTRAPESPAKGLSSSGKHDPAARRRSQRRGRERGCWVYIPADGLAKAGFASDDPPPWYRIWAGRRGRYIVTLYREP